MTANEQQQRLEAMLQPLPISATLFPPTSRYAGIELAVFDSSGDRPIVFLRRRFVPHPESLSLIREHIVVAGERPDHIAASELGDSELFWRLCDANRTIASELVDEIGRRLRVSMPAGLPGGAND